MRPPFLLLLALPLRFLHAVPLSPIGHKVYEPGTQAYHQVIAAFGRGVVAEDGQINRKALGALVFGEAHKARMKQLTYRSLPRH